MDLIELLLGKTRKAFQNAPKRQAEGNITPREIAASAFGPLGEKYLGSERQKERANAGLELASYAVPLGKGNLLSKFAVPGALSGILGSASRDEDLTKGAIGGAIGGGVGGVVSKVGGKVFNTLTKDLPENIMNKVFKESIKQTKAGVKTGETLGKMALERSVRGSEDSILQQALNKINSLEGAVEKTLTKSKATVPIDDILKTTQPLINEYMDAGNEAASKSLENRIMNLWARHGDNIPVSKANEIKRTLYKEVGDKYGTAGSEGVEGLKNVARGLKESIARQVPDISKFNEALGFEGRVRDAMVDKIAREGRNKMFGLTDLLFGGPAAIAGGPLAMAGAIGAKKIGESTAGQTGVANILNAGGNIMNSSKIPQLLSQALNISGAQVGSRLPVGQQSVNESNNYQGNNGTNSPFVHTPQSIPQGQEIAKDGDISPGGQWRFDAKANDWVPNTSQGPQAQETGFTKDKIGQMMLLDLMQTGGKNITELATIAQFVVPEEKTQKAPSATSLQVKGKATAGLAALDEIENQISNNPNVLLLSNIPGSPGARQYEAAISSITDAIGGLRTGATVSKEQQAYYRNLLPKVGDSPETIKKKLQAVRNELAVYLEGSGQIEDPLQSILNVAR